MGTIENRPRMLKEFLRDDSFYSSTSSSIDFTTYPRKNLPCKSKVQVVSSKSMKPSLVLLRSRSKRAISAVHKVINVVKFFHFSPLLLPRRISRNVSCKDKNADVSSNVSEVKVKVKDILRWKSFRDLEQDKSTPLDFTSSPNRSIITAATTTTTTTSCSKNSSWCDSDFTVEELPLWCGENEGFLGKKILIGQPNGTNTTFKNPEEELWLCEEYEQQSPISVLDSPFQQVEESISPYHPSLANIQSARCIITRRIQEVEHFNKQKYTKKHNNPTLEKAKHLLSQFKESNDHDLILDFFMHELNGKLNEVEILSIAKSWINGKCDDYEWNLEEKRDAYVKDMEKDVCWNKFQQEQGEMSKEFEMVILNELIDEVLVYLIIT